MKYKQKTSWYLVICSLIIMSSSLLVSFWLLWPYDIIQLNNSPYPIVSREVHVGGSVEFYADFCIKKSYPAAVAQEFIDHIKIALADRVFQGKVGCYKQNIAVYVPALLTPGTYHIATTAIYKVNPLRTITYHSETQDFLVTK